MEEQLEKKKIKKKSEGCGGEIERYFSRTLLEFGSFAYKVSVERRVWKEYKVSSEEPGKNDSFTARNGL